MWKVSCHLMLGLVATEAETLTIYYNMSLFLSTYLFIYPSFNIDHKRYSAPTFNNICL